MAMEQVLHQISVLCLSLANARHSPIALLRGLENGLKTFGISSKSLLRAKESESKSTQQRTDTPLQAIGNHRIFLNQQLALLERNGGHGLVAGD